VPFRVCPEINGVQHCFDIPVLIKEVILPPDPNFPELELAITVLELVKAVRTIAPQSELTQKLADVSTGFIKEVQQGLPAGVELIEVGAVRT
jgi:hypothetical protein